MTWRAYPKPPSRVKVKHDINNAAERSWQLVRKQVLARDNYECRVMTFQRTHGGGPFGTCIGPLDVHHWRPRSVGGESVPHALITVCRFHHSEMHNWRLFADAQTKHGADGAIVWSVGT